MKKLFLVVVTGIIMNGVVGQTKQPKPDSPTSKGKKEVRRERINNLIKLEEEGELIFHKQSIFGFKAATDGYGLSYEIGKFRSNRTTTIFQFELNEKKHPKENKISAVDINGLQFNSFIRGKMNNFYQFKISAGQQRIIGGKGNKNGVAVGLIFGGGLSVGLLKPYLIDVESNTGQRFRSTYPKIFDSSYTELSSSGFTTGWDELKVKPGVNAKVAMRFDYGRFNETITGIEVGLTGEYYPGKIAQIAYNKEKPFFFNAYLSLLLGRRR